MLFHNFQAVHHYEQDIHNLKNQIEAIRTNKDTEINLIKQTLTQTETDKQKIIDKLEKDNQFYRENLAVLRQENESLK